MNLLETALKGRTDRVIALDPGETTGVCVFDGPTLVCADQLATGLMPKAAWTVWDFLMRFRSHRAVCVIEDYRVYSWKAEDHSWAPLHTVRLIGAVEFICHYQLQELPLVKQSAQNAKGFCTDEKLQQWGVYIKGQKHARDAIRHACFYLLFQVAKVQTPPTRR